MRHNEIIKRLNSVNVIDPETCEMREGRDIVIRGGKIKEIRAGGPAAGVGPDVKGLYAMPGLIDTHVHAMGIFYDGEPGPAEFLWVFGQQKRNLEFFARGGVTTVRDLGAPLNVIRTFSRLAEVFAIVSPRVLYSGPVLTVEDGYPDFVKDTPPVARAVLGSLRVDIKSPAHAKQVVSRLAGAGVHTIKICNQSARYDDARTPIPVMPQELMRAVASAAHDRNLPVTIHCVYAADLPAVLDVPFDSIEHIPIDAAISPELAARVAKKNIPMCGTMMTYGIIDHVERYEQLLKDDRRRFEAAPRKLMAQACKALKGEIDAELYVGRRAIETGSKYVRENVALLRAAGVKITCGTDSGGAITPTGVPLWEFLDMKRAGMNNAEILRSATCMAADALNQPDLGRILPGAAADILLLRRNPMDDITAVEDIAAVIRSGRVIVNNL